MTLVLVGAVGFLLGLAAHDLGVQALEDDVRLRPLAGSCPRCGSNGLLSLRCGRCGRIRARELILAVSSALAAVTFSMAVDPDWLLVPYLAFLGLSAALVVSDLEAFRIVDRLNLRGTAFIVLLLAAVSIPLGHWEALLRGLGGGVAYFAGAALMFILVRGRGFGAGDVKLAAQLGVFTAYLGWGVLGWAAMGTALIGGVVAIGLIAFGKAGRNTEMPYGPPMVMGAWTAIAMVGVGAIPVPS